MCEHVPMAELSADFSEALVFAARLHRSQRRKGPGGAPYLAHLLSVAATVLEFGGAEEEAIAALLHDAVEDQGGAPTRQLIARMFGERVAAIVDACTDTDVEPKPPWKERKDAFLGTLPGASPSALLVILADKLHNVRSTLRDLKSTGAETWKRFRGGREGTLWYYRSIADAVRPADERTRALAAEFREAVDELERLARQLEKG